MKKCLIVRYDEIGLKGSRVRSEMEQLLITNIRKSCNERLNIKKIGPRIIIYTEKKNLIKNLVKVFGVSSISNSVEINQDLDLIKKTALSFYKKGKFRITTQRITKEFKLNSQRLSEEVGGFIIQNKKAKVSLKNYDVNISIELLKEKAYIFSDKIKGFGGLPISSQGKVLCKLENKRDMLACLMIMNRGCYPLITGDKEYYNILNKFVNNILNYYTSEEKIRKKVSGIVSSEKLSKKILVKEELPIFHPLIGLSEKTINEKYHIF